MAKGTAHTDICRGIGSSGRLDTGERPKGLYPLEDVGWFRHNGREKASSVNDLDITTTCGQEERRIWLPVNHWLVNACSIDVGALPSA